MGNNGKKKFLDISRMPSHADMYTKELSGAFYEFT